MVKVEPVKLTDWHQPEEPIIEDVSPEELEAPVISAQEMQAMVDQAVAEGYNEGMAKGLAEGRSQGFDEGKSLGHAEGFTQGQKEGFTQGIKDAQAQADQQLQQELGKLSQLYHSLSSARDYVEAEVEQVLVQMSLQLAASLVQADLSQHQERLLNIISQGIDALPVGADLLQIIAHPQDEQWLQQHYHNAQVNWQLVPDANLTPGSLQIKSKQSLVNLTLEHRWLQQVGLLSEQMDLQALPILQSVAAKPEPEPEPEPEARDEP